ncbi:PDR/VanB family oxidoreductase [Nocardioides daeguensis]|uniref:PDR/VanB family oxidoreductase n=1 Tax=Nocardioides daeguensis TaxID=908359 RepID=A0ABP6UW55_9ACTN|nr:PDR/VanB family oxidoreductase [Nocardioides daeguensis]MBV6725574.1 PDR/VanB family oxidoreductase [Nocardioides daeguensis]MCR1771434.1 PDR/VanB family oxidoreductase [Nocardioides daeguensis]
MSILEASPAAAPSATLAVRVEHVIPVADGIVSLRLTGVDGAPLPTWSPGAHIDLHLGDVVRQYSLCGVPDEPGYQVAVLREPASRGGSAYVHEQLSVGDTLTVSTPRNHFELRPSPRYLFLAGGIGITPILTMVRAADAAGADWRLVYGGRSLATMAFRDELAAYGDRVQLRPQDEHGLLDLAGLLGTPLEDTAVYCCGPAPLLSAVEEHCATWPSGSLHVEHFTAAEVDTSADGAFEVEFRASGVTVSVPAGTSVLDAAAAVGVDIERSCSSGVCGTCESLLLEGEPDHRDHVLTDEDREEGYFMPCVSRALGPRLVLDR